MEGLKTTAKLTAVETALINKLSRPESFQASEEELEILGSFLARKIVRKHRDGSLEVTDHGADCYIETLEF